MQDTKIKEIPSTYKSNPVLCRMCDNLVTFAGLRIKTFKGLGLFSSLLDYQLLLHVAPQLSEQLLSNTWLPQVRQLHRHSNRWLTRATNTISNRT